MTADSPHFTASQEANRPKGPQFRANIPLFATTTSFAFTKNGGLVILRYVSGTGIGFCVDYMLDISIDNKRDSK